VYSKEISSAIRRVLDEGGVGKGAKGGLGAGALDRQPTYFPRL
jgi:hypothetical protein